MGRVTIKEKESFATNIGFLQDAVDDLSLAGNIVDSVDSAMSMGFEQRRVPQNARQELNNIKKSIDKLNRLLSIWVSSG